MSNYLQPFKIDPNSAEWLWHQVKDQDYGFDDVSRGRPDLFVRHLIRPGAEHFLLGQDGYVVVENIHQPVNATIHFAVWNQARPRQLVEAGNQLLTYLFHVKQLHRVTAPVPAFNDKAAKFARLMGFKQEGVIRETFLHHGTYHDIIFYGLLQTEFKWKGVVH